MADTLEQIFNVTLDDTDLASGEATVLTTNSTTRFVVKDIAVDNGSAITNASLELNGFDVADLTGDNSGSLIVPPDSTLKIKSSQHPLSFEDINWTFTPVDQSLLVTDTQPFIGPLVQSTASTQITRPSRSEPYYAHIVTPTHVYWQNNWDGNSAGHIYYTALDNLSNQTLISPSSYRGNMVFDGRYIIWQGSSNVMRWDTTTNTESNVSLANYQTNSSYPRNFYVEGTRYVLYSSSSEGRRLVNMDTGSSIQLSHNAWASENASTYQIFGVYNSTDDIFYLGALTGSTPNMYLKKLANASTYLNVTSGIQSATLETIYDNVGMNASEMNIADMYVNQISLYGRHDNDGTWLYFTRQGNNAVIRRVNLDKATLAGSHTLTGTSEDVITLSQTPYSWNDKVVMTYGNATTAAEQTARNYDVSSYNIKAYATGVKVV